MTNRSKAKGTSAETAVVSWLRENGHIYAERRALSGSQDKGDVAGLPGVVLEIKDCKRMELAAWVDEARQEAANAGVDVYAVIHKRPRKGDPGEWYVTLPLSVFAEVIK